MKYKELEKVEIVFFDFDGVFTDNRVIISETGIENVICYRSDGIGLSRLKSKNVIAYIISSEKNALVLKRAKKLKIKCLNAIENKGKEIIRICKTHKIKLSNAMFVGNDINDISGLEIVGFPVGVNDSSPEIYKYLKFKTEKKGGFGAVREICDLIYFNKK